MKNINSYIIEKLKINKDVINNYSDGTKIADKIYDMLDMTDILNDIRIKLHKEPPVYEQIKKWAKEYDIEDVTGYIKQYFVDNYIPKLNQKCIDKFILDDKKFDKAFQLIHTKKTEIWEGPAGVTQVVVQYNENGFLWYCDVDKKILSLFLNSKLNGKIR